MGGGLRKYGALDRDANGRIPLILGGGGGGGYENSRLLSETQIVGSPYNDPNKGYPEYRKHPHKALGGSCLGLRGFRA